LETQITKLVALGGEKGNVVAAAKETAPPLRGMFQTRDSLVVGYNTTIKTVKGNVHGNYIGD